MVALNWGNTLTGDDMAIFGSIQTLTVYNDPLLDQQWLYSGAQAEGTISRTRLLEGADIANPAKIHVTGGSATYRVADMEVIDVNGSAQLLTSAVEDTRMAILNIGYEGRLSTQTNEYVSAPLTQLHTFDVAGQSLVATGARDTGGLQIYAQSGTDLTLLSQVDDHAKAALGNIADLTHVSKGADTYLVTGSVADEGISSFKVGADGQTELIDTLGTKDGLWLAGLDSVTAVQAHGVDYVVVGATNSSSLSLVRVNDMGVFFVEDHTYDTLNSRFFRVDAVTSFEVGERGFVVAGGADDGLSLFEILPDKSLFQHDALPNQVGGALSSITALTTAHFPTEVQVIAAGQPGMTMARIDITTIAEPKVGSDNADYLVGSAQNDLIFGRNGHDTLLGGGGHDVMSGGAGIDVMTGGAGADTFIFTRDTLQDRVMDFNLAEDHLDISDWGRIYDVSSLNVTETYNGVIISYQAESLRLYSHDGQRINVEDVTNDLFLF